MTLEPIPLEELLRRSHNLRMPAIDMHAPEDEGVVLVEYDAAAGHIPLDALYSTVPEALVERSGNSVFCYGPHAIPGSDVRYRGRGFDLDPQGMVVNCAIWIDHDGTINV